MKLRYSCDPVESNVVVVTLADGTMVGMSDWILPTWQNADNIKGPFNHLNTLTEAFQVKNGYLMQIKHSKVNIVYGETVNTTSHSQTGLRTSVRLKSVINQ